MSATDRQQALTDGSAAADRGDRVEIDRSIEAERWRYRCPEGHTDWAPTNNHIWCKGCRRQLEAGEDVDPEHYHLVDSRTGEEIHWSRVRLVEQPRRNTPY